MRTGTIGVALVFLLGAGVLIGCDAPKPKPAQTPAKMIDPPKDDPKPAGG